MTARTLTMTLALAAAMPLLAQSGSAPFVYDATGLRDPMVKPLFVSATNLLGGAASPQSAQARRADIERVVLAARIEGVAISARTRGAIINDRLVREGDPIAPGQAVRIVRIERDRIVFVLDNETYDFYLTPTQETTAP